MFNLMNLVGALRGGGDPNALIQQAIRNHPQSEQIQQIVGGKSPDQLMMIAENMCRERGTSIDAVLKQFGISR